METEEACSFTPSSLVLLFLLPIASPTPASHARSPPHRYVTAVFCPHVRVAYFDCFLFDMCRAHTTHTSCPDNRIRLNLFSLDVPQVFVCCWWCRLRAGPRGSVRMRPAGRRALTIRTTHTNDTIHSIHTTHTIHATPYTSHNSYCTVYILDTR